MQSSLEFLSSNAIMVANVSPSCAKNVDNKFISSGVLSFAIEHAKADINVTNSQELIIITSYHESILLILLYI